MSDRQRADARRNYARILTVADAEVAAHGAEASLEQIARTAGVGSATVRRHFPTRQALLEAVSHDRVEALRVRAQELAGTSDSRTALLTWLGELIDYCVTARGLATALSYEHDADPIRGNSCAATIEEAAAPLLRAAARDGRMSADVTPSELITLVVGMALATEHATDPAARANRLLAITVAGLSPSDDHPAALRSNQ
ncbi:TetR/AcrR family transcriptional regulator [Microlunatus soli]|uniref:Regulatory protein, tetR family n=1 Tax=Microlunatus soli TaxID=630515 RepID=A0A1H1WD27_9ACTN|nr:TetR/AcrR family transcriptional regulator [Microlunatus soli]SDS94039.1 regulatory protein, tetR family [Microlunatus soli]